MTKITGDSDRTSTNIENSNDIYADNIENASIETKHLKDNSISLAKMKNDSVGTSQLVNDSVTTSKINNGAVDNNKLATGSVSSDELLNNSVDTNKLNINADLPMGGYNIDSCGDIIGSYSNISITGSNNFGGLRIHSVTTSDDTTAPASVRFTDGVNSTMRFGIVSKPEGSLQGQGEAFIGANPGHTFIICDYDHGEGSISNRLAEFNTSRALYSTDIKLADTKVIMDSTESNYIKAENTNYDKLEYTGNHKFTTILFDDQNTNNLVTFDGTYIIWKPSAAMKIEGDIDFDTASSGTIQGIEKLSSPSMKIDYSYHDMANSSETSLNYDYHQFILISDNTKFIILGNPPSYYFASFTILNPSGTAQDVVFEYSTDRDIDLWDQLGTNQNLTSTKSVTIEIKGREQRHIIAYSTNQIFVR